MLPKMTFTYPELSNLLLRVSVGTVFIYHGAQKLFGAFGGPGISGFTQFMIKLQIPYPSLSAWLTAFTEFFGGMALAFGIFPRWVALPLVFTMLMAIVFVTGGKGFNIVNGGAEYNFILIMALLAIFFQGPGKWCIRK